MNHDDGTPTTVVVGGSLAKLTAALRLSEHGRATLLVEAGNRRGGKCGADWDGKNHNEHAYYLFPDWYVNFLNLVDQLGIRGRLADLPVFGFMCGVRVRRREGKSRTR